MLWENLKNWTMMRSSKPRRPHRLKQRYRGSVSNNRQNAKSSLTRFVVPLFSFFLLFYIHLSQWDQALSARYRTCQWQHQSMARKGRPFPKLHEVHDENCNRTSHTSMHPRIAHPREPNEPTSPVGRWSRGQPVLPLDKQLSQNLIKSPTQKLANETKYK